MMTFPDIPDPIAKFAKLHPDAVRLMCQVPLTDDNGYPNGTYIMMSKERYDALLNAVNQNPRETDR